MKGKTELTFNELNYEIIKYQISSFFNSNSKEIGGLLSMNKKYYTLFNTDIQPKRILTALLNSFNSGDQNTSEKILKAYPKFQINQLLWYVVSGNPIKAYEILKQNPKLLLERGSIIDMSGRHFNSITPFELVLWNMDVRYMAGMMLNCIPKNEDGNEINKKLLLQYNNVEEKGVNFTLNGKQCNEKHFSYQPLIDTLQTYVTNYDNWSNEQRVDYWCKEVGREQFMLTIEGRNQYCHLTRSFYPMPDFKEEHLERNLTFCNYVRNKKQVWDSGLIGLGADFGILRGGQDGHAAGAATLYAVRAGIDFAAVSHLCEVRTKDHAALKERLELSSQNSEEKQEFHQMIF